MSNTANHSGEPVKRDTGPADGTVVVVVPSSTTVVSGATAQRPGHGPSLARIREAVAEEHDRQGYDPLKRWEDEAFKDGPWHGFGSRKD
ncbi:hypothetical protein GGTG_11906 [Gaeumannomyces tritici R3-111a-1]|uniref:Uncharacterized protein n=1 Tax=Gaeumannomyces tritici (strain R3-111a-1) TaxID=644352 RepID=J3PEH5_GAET3|nr:hypothetical protein GGTG_11906 [Gaeumannomyces tritici R3-111a-1]EJT70883.1 hypothetical protein GGTG_11906 [Gaeumannomyces tritici R3-111a-1]